MRTPHKNGSRISLHNTYQIVDTGESIIVSKVGAEEVTSHRRNDLAHLKSISVIPSLLNNAIFIEEQKNNKDNDKFDSYRYYVPGVNIDGEDYTAKIVIGVKQGERKRAYLHSAVGKEVCSSILNI